MADREDADLFFWLRSFGLRRTWQRKIWRSEYFWHDTFGIRWNRLVGCRLLGHATPHNINDYMPDAPPQWWCFDCHQTLKLEDIE